jgi:hypothetical protein
MPLKQAFGAAALPVAGGAAVAIAAVVGYVLFTGGPTDPALAPKGVGQTQTVAAPEPAAPETAALKAKELEPQTPQAPAAQASNSVTTAPQTSDPVPSVAPTRSEAEQKTNIASQDKSNLDPAPVIPASPTDTDPNSNERPAEAAQQIETPVPAVPLIATAPDMVPDMAAPTIDIVRIPPEGISTVAGRADAGADILIFIDGVEVARARAGGSGEFVALFDIPPVERPRELQVAAQLGDRRVLSSGSIVIAPFVSVPDVAMAQAQDPTSVGTDDKTADGKMTDVDVPSAQASIDMPAPTAPQSSPTVMVASDTGVKILQSAAPFQGVSIDAITYDPDGAVFASGRGTAGATVRLYLSNSPLMDTAIGSDGHWRARMDVDAGIYSLRADMVDAAGKVLGRVEIPFKREDVAVLARLAQPTGENRPVDPGQNDSATPLSAPNDESVKDNGMRAEKNSGGTAAPAPRPRIASITVQPGNTLWGIASDTYGDGFLYARVFSANVAQIRDPDLIYPGQVFELPPN